MQTRLTQGDVGNVSVVHLANLVILTLSSPDRRANALQLTVDGRNVEEGTCRLKPICLIGQLMESVVSL